MNRIQLRKDIDEYIQSIPIYMFAMPFILHSISSEAIYKKRNNSKNVYDVIVSNTEDYSNYRCLTTMICCIIIGFCIYKYICAYKSSEKDKFKILKSLFKHLAVILLIRAITIQLTILPEFPYGEGYINPISRVFFGHTCDFIFSGHTSVILTFILVFYKYNILNNLELKIATALHFIMAFSLVLTRLHYTIDVFIGYLITIVVFLFFDL